MIQVDEMKLDFLIKQHVRYCSCSDCIANKFCNSYEIRKANSTKKRCMSVIKMYMAGVACKEAIKLPNGKCLGYGYTEYDDEPIEKCKNCPKYDLYGVE